MLRIVHIMPLQDGWCQLLYELSDDPVSASRPRSTRLARCTSASYLSSTVSVFSTVSRSRLEALSVTSVRAQSSVSETLGAFFKSIPRKVWTASTAWRASLGARRSEEHTSE